MTYGNIVLANSKTGIVAQIIKFLTRSSFSHSLITCPDVLGYPMCIEAAGNGISMLRFDEGYILNPLEGFEMYSFEVSEDVKAKGLVSCIERLETPYGYLELVWFMYRAFSKLIGRDIKSENNWSTQGVICSQLCVDYITACGHGDLFSGFGVGSVNAQDLRDVMQANPQLFKLIKVKQ